jgi:hypothetical protein
MAKFILAFRKLLNLLSFTAPSQEQISALSNDEAIAYVNAEDDGSITLIGVGNDGEPIELAKGTVVSE